MFTRQTKGFDSQSPVRAVAVAVEAMAELMPEATPVHMGIEYIKDYVDGFEACIEMGFKGDGDDDPVTPEDQLEPDLLEEDWPEKPGETPQDARKRDKYKTYFAQADDLTRILESYYGYRVEPTQLTELEFVEATQAMARQKMLQSFANTARFVTNNGDTEDTPRQSTPSIPGESPGQDPDTPEPH